MIDDDFDKMIRQMFEQFFGGTLSPNGTGSNTMRFKVSQNPGSSREPETHTGPFLEKIDLGNEILIVVDTIAGEPMVKVEGREVTISSPLDNKP
ncbi:MAG: hypothetical protein GF411_16445, partial [Candidatus Lokiarchaeota archaeon]|nr:hypothetical protein [Candidatus Lokiarchaeota archaeon]